MYSVWHNTILGAYSQEDRWLGLDYQSLLTDPLKTRLTMAHEMTHYVLCKDTEFGQAVEKIYELLPQFIHINKDDKEKLKNALRQSQVFVQEGSASLMEILDLKKTHGKRYALDWARKNFPKQYYERLEKLLFVVEMGERYSSFFTSKVPFAAMHTDIRRQLVQQDLLSDIPQFIDYLSKPENSPDQRFNNMLDTLRGKNWMVTKPEEVICKEVGIPLVSVSKEELAEYLTYLLKFTKYPRIVSPSEIGEPREVTQTMEQSFEDTLVADMNMNFADNGTVLWEIKDLLHYQKEIKAILVNRFGDEAEWRKELEVLTGKKYEAGLVAFLSTGEQFIIGLSYEEVSSLTQNELFDKTLLVKWGLYFPNMTELMYFPKSRVPNVVIYNSLKHLKATFAEYFKNKHKATFIAIAYKGHPFRTLVIKDHNGVLHWLNTYGDKLVNPYLDENKDCLLKENPQRFLQDHQHFNRVLYVWMSYPWDVDWYEKFQNELKAS